MNRNKIALIAGGVTGLVGFGIALHTLGTQREEMDRLKADNVILLRNTFVALDAAVHQRPIPIPVLQDLEFRRMAFMVEYEDIEDEPEEN